MDDLVLVIGILLGGAGAVELVWTHLNPQPKRREKRRIRNLLHRAQEAGLRGRYRFRGAGSSEPSVGRYGTYEPADGEDRALYSAIGSRIEGESALFASEALWTDARLAWVGIPALILGIAICAVSMVG
jgi:hypothetical protein